MNKNEDDDNQPPQVADGDQAVMNYDSSLRDLVSSMEGPLMANQQLKQKAKNKEDQVIGEESGDDKSDQSGDQFWSLAELSELIEFLKDKKKDLKEKFKENNDEGVQEKETGYVLEELAVRSIKKRSSAQQRALFEGRFLAIIDQIVEERLAKIRKQEEEEREEKNELSDQFFKIFERNFKAKQFYQQVTKLFVEDQDDNEAKQQELENQEQQQPAKEGNAEKERDSEVRIEPDQEHQVEKKEKESGELLLADILIQLNSIKETLNLRQSVDFKVEPKDPAEEEKDATLKNDNDEIDQNVKGNTNVKENIPKEEGDQQQEAQPVQEKTIIADDLQEIKRLLLFEMNQNNGGLTQKIDECLDLLNKINSETQNIKQSQEVVQESQKKLEDKQGEEGSHLERLTTVQVIETNKKIDRINDTVKEVGQQIEQKIDDIITKQLEQSKVIQAQTEAVSKMEEKAQTSETKKEEVKVESQDSSSKIAQDLVDRKIGQTWTISKTKFQIQGKYSFAAHTHQDMIFVDGNGNNIDVLRKDDLQKISSLDTSGNCVFSFIVNGLKLYAGCAKNNLYIFELDAMRRFKEIKTTGIIYCFLQLDYNTLLAGETGGNLQIFALNNPTQPQNITLKELSHITNVSRTSRPNEIALSTIKGLFFSEIVDFGDWRVTLIEENYYKFQDIRAAVEFKRDQFIVCIDMDQNIYIVDRKYKQTMKQFENPSGNDRPLTMRLIPSYDNEKLPFALLRDQEGISVINTKSHQAYQICQSWYHQLPYPQQMLEAYKVIDNGTIDCLVLEYMGKDSHLVKIELSSELIAAFRNIAKSDF